MKHNTHRLLTKEDKRKIQIVCNFLKEVPANQRERYCTILERVSREEARHQ